MKKKRCSWTSKDRSQRLGPIGPKLTAWLVGMVREHRDEKTRSHPQDMAKKIRAGFQEAWPSSSLACGQKEESGDGMG